MGTHRAYGRARIGLTLSLLAALYATVAGPSPGFAAQIEDRPVPNYDGRAEPRPTVGEVLIWVPRVLFFPVYAATEYLVRWPLGALLTWIERVGLLRAVGPVGFYPTMFIEFDFRPSVGIYFFADEIPTDNDAFRIHFAWGGERWWYLTVRQRFRRAVVDHGRDPNLPLTADEVSLHFEFKMFPDRLFLGLGPDTTEATRSRYFRRIVGGHIDGELIFGQGNGVAFSMGAEGNLLEGTDFRDDPSIETVFDVTDPAQVPGFEQYALGYLETRLRLDSRSPRPTAGSGGLLELLGRFGADLGELDRRFVRVQGQLAGFVDLSGRNHTLSLRQYAGMVEDVGSVPVPFTELERLGGFELMRGFSTDRYFGESALVTTAQYTFPIWVFLDGFLFYEVGNVFGPHFEGFGFGSLASSFGGGLRTTNDRDLILGLLIGAGTDPFDHSHFGIADVSVRAGVTSGF